MKCKNCGRPENSHGDDCGQFIPSIKVDCLCGKIHVSPSCSNHSPIDESCSKLSEDKEPDDNKRLRETSGSDFNLPRLRENVKNWRIKEIEFLRNELEEKDLKFREFIRLLKEDLDELFIQGDLRACFDNQKLEGVVYEKIDKLSGEFK